MAELIGVTYQQAHKYEMAVNRISAGRLYQLALALGVDIDYFYENANPGKRQQELIPAQRMLLELARNFSLIKNRRHQAAVCAACARPKLSRLKASGSRQVRTLDQTHPGEQVRGSPI